VERNLNIIVLNIPYPPDYGGMIDSFYKIKSLHAIGIKIHLHCFEYGRQHRPKMEAFCTSVNYYRRSKSLPDILTAKPFIVASRSSDELLVNLMKNDYPILFDGLHTTFHLNNPKLINRKKYVRTHNIEHKYYEALSMEEKNSFKSMFFTMEAAKLNRYEKILRKADQILCISQGDLKYFSAKYNKSRLFEPWHPFGKIESLNGSGAYVLFHADLSVPANIAAAEFMCEEIAPNINLKLIIAGKKPSPGLISLASNINNTMIVSDPTEEEMTDLIQQAHINIAIGKNSNGFRLRLLYSLFAGRHCIANHKMLEGTGLEKYFTICDTPESVVDMIQRLSDIPFTHEMTLERINLLEGRFNNLKKASELAELIFN
jgi:hypothetical protein